MSRVLLIDADVIAYEAVAACEKEVEFEPGYFTYTSDFSEVLDTFHGTLKNWISAIDGDDYRLCLTDSAGNFRKAILPTYKGKRAKKPLCLKHLKEHLIASDERAVFRPGLEGDDCMGILATKSGWPKGTELVIVSPDKDMFSVPGKFARWPSTIITSHTRQQADRYHLLQTLTGDVTDGYAGCPGIGPVKAEKLLDKAPTWETVVGAYEAAGLTEDDALVQARVARILRADDYDFVKKEVILWEP